jgi:GMP synthase PP-ATPase subunit
MVAELKKRFKTIRWSSDFLASDSTVAAVLVHQAIGKILYILSIMVYFVRTNSPSTDQYKGMGLNVKALMLEIDFLSSGRS